MLVELSQSPIELLALRLRERKRLVLPLGGDAVPEFLDQLQPLGGRELEELLAEAVAHGHESASDPLLRQAAAAFSSRRSELPVKRLG